MTKSTQPEVTTAAVWKLARKEGEIITLPSGNVARLRPVSLDILITSGTMPDMLTPVAAKTLWSDEGTDYNDIAALPEMAKGFADLVNFVVPAAFIEPVVVEKDKKPGTDQISIEDVEFGDKVAVFNLATSGAATLRKFREQQARNVEDVPDNESNGDTPE